MSFATRESCCWLTELDIAETDFLNCFQLWGDAWDICEKFNSFVNCHIKNFGNIFAFVFDFESFVIITLAVTIGAGDVDVGEEVHFDFVDAVALAMLATTAFDVERETTSFVAAELGLGLGGVETADSSKDTSVGGGVATRGATDGGLVDDDDFVEIFDAVDVVVEAGDGLSVV